MRPLPSRPRSRTAVWALRLALVTPLLALVSLVAHRIGQIGTADFITLVWVCLALALTSLALVVLSLRGLWLRGKKGGRRAIGALVLTLAMLAPFGWAAWAYVVLPMQADVSTDLIEPPLFLDELRDLEGDADAIIAASLQNGYPDLTGRRYDVDLERMNQLIEEVALEQGFAVERRRGRVSANDEISIEFSWRSPILHLPHEIVVRLTDEGETAYVDMRSRTVFGSHDLGTNAALIERFLTALDYASVSLARL